MKSKNLVFILIINFIFNLYCAHPDVQSGVCQSISTQEEQKFFDEGIQAFSKQHYKEARKFLEPIAKFSNNSRLKIEAIYHLAQINYQEKFYELAKNYIDKGLAEPKITGIQKRLFNNLATEVNKFLKEKSYEEKEIENLMYLENKVPYRKLKIHMQGDKLNDSYEGLILRYKTELRDKNFNLAHTLLNLIAEIAYTKEGYANEDPKIAEFLAKKGFTLDEIKEKLKSFKYDRDRSLIYISESGA